AMFKLPAAAESTTEQTAISALSTAALNAPTGETATFLQIDHVIDDHRGGAAASGAKPAASDSLGSGRREVRALEPEPAKSKTGLFVVVGVAAIALLAVGAMVVFGGGKE